MLWSKSVDVLVNLCFPLVKFLLTNKNQVNQDAAWQHSHCWLVRCVWEHKYRKKFLKKLISVQISSRQHISLLVQVGPWFILHLAATQSAMGADMLRHAENIHLHFHHKQITTEFVVDWMKTSFSESLSAAILVHTRVWYLCSDTSRTEQRWFENAFIVLLCRASRKHECFLITQSHFGR